jgi:hypothetical protein
VGGAEALPLLEKARLDRRMQPIEARGATRAADAKSIATLFSFFMVLLSRGKPQLPAIRPSPGSIDTVKGPRVRTFHTVTAMIVP